MKKNRTTKIIYLLIAISLFIASKYAEAHFHSDLEGKIKFFSILINSIFVAYYYCVFHDSETKKIDLIAYGLFLTVIGDYFLTYKGTEEYYLPGIIFFCLVQILYMIYIKPKAIEYIFRCLLFITGIIILIHYKQLSILTFFGLLDIVMIIFNTISSWLSKNVPLLFKLGITYKK